MIGLDGVEEQVKTYERRGFVGVGRIAVMVFTAESEAAESKAEYEVPKGVWGDLKDARREEWASALWCGVVWWGGENGDDEE